MQHAHDDDARRDEDDLRATSDAIVEDLTKLQRIESEKRRLEPGDPETARLAGKVTELAERVHVTSLAQRELSKQLVGDGETDTDRPIRA